MSNSNWYLIAYDIREPRRLRRVQGFLRCHAYTLQRSVFAWQGTHRELAEFKRRLAALICPREDDVRGYPLASGDGILWWGSSPIPVGIMVENAPRIMLQPA